MNTNKSGEFILKWIEEDINENNRSIEQMKKMFGGIYFFQNTIKSKEEYTKKLEKLKNDYLNGKFKELIDFYREYTSLSKQK